MRTTAILSVLLSFLLLCGCSRKPTLDNLTYYEAAHLVEIEKAQA